MAEEPPVPGYEQHIDVVMGIFSAADACRRENIALRSILREQGLSDRAIQTKVKQILNNPDQSSTGAHIVEQACQETIKRLRHLDAQQVLAKLDPVGGVQ